MGWGAGGEDEEEDEEEKEEGLRRNRARRVCHAQVRCESRTKMPPPQAP